MQFLIMNFIIIDTFDGERRISHETLEHSHGQKLSI